MQVCTSLQTDNHISTPPLSFLQAGCPSCRPTNSVKAQKAKTLNKTQSTNYNHGKWHTDLNLSWSTARVLREWTFPLRWLPDASTIRTFALKFFINQSEGLKGQLDNPEWSKMSLTCSIFFKLMLDAKPYAKTMGYFFHLYTFGRSQVSVHQSLHRMGIPLNTYCTLK